MTQKSREERLAALREELRASRPPSVAKEYKMAAHFLREMHTHGFSYGSAECALKLATDALRSIGITESAKIPVPGGIDDELILDSLEYPPKQIP